MGFGVCLFSACRSLLDLRVYPETSRAKILIENLVTQQEFCYHGLKILQITQRKALAQYVHLLSRRE